VTPGGVRGRASALTSPAAGAAVEGTPAA